ncbi:hypothetical protein DFR76_101216 [Nocardia pseudobrasiliensis]|uniref:Uncharacterized protein n=1 Tax=Nocardia pseudobrasiliensis TaxID=45979 RepID=A0A370IEX9_9NOCA|nr:hypothetical protein DFR76_101216 [Nocardia pseudobrasiliensis]
MELLDGLNSGSSLLSNTTSALINLLTLMRMLGS